MRINIKVFQTKILPHAIANDSAECRNLQHVTYASSLALPPAPLFHSPHMSISPDAISSVPEVTDAGSPASPLTYDGVTRLGWSSEHMPHPQIIDIYPSRS